MRRICMPATVASLLLALAACQSTPSSSVDPLIGKWICRDLSHTGHTAHIPAMMMNFMPTGEFESFYQWNDGERTRVERDDESPRWSASNGRLHIGDAPPMAYQIAGSKLRLDITDMYGDTLTLHFTRE